MRANTSAAIHRPDLGIAVFEYIEGATMQFIGTQLMPIFRTARDSSSYLVIPKEALLKLSKTDRAPRGNYRRDDFEYERGFYSVTEDGFEELVDDTERALFDIEGGENLSDIMAVQRAAGKVLRGQEYEIAQKLNNATNFTANAVSTEWDTAATCTPIDDINDAKSAFRLQCGMMPNVLRISYDASNDLKNCDQIVDRVKYTFPGFDINSIGAEQLAHCFGVPKVLIGGSVYDSKGKGLDTTITDMWSNEYAALHRVAETMDPREPCVGRTWLWTEDSPSSPVVESYREEQKRSDVYRVRQSASPEFVQSKDKSGTVVSNISAACTYLISNCHT